MRFASRIIFRSDRPRCNHETDYQPARMDIMKIIRTLLIRRITVSCEIAPSVFMSDTLCSGVGVTRAARRTEFTSITVAAGGINHENCKSALTYARPGPYTQCAYTALGVRASRKTARHISIRDLCDLRCRASCARSLSTDQSGCRCCRRCCCSTETRLVVCPFFQRHLQLPVRVCRCSSNTRNRHGADHRVYGYVGCVHA